MTAGSDDWKRSAVEFVRQGMPWLGIGAGFWVLALIAVALFWLGGPWFLIVMTRIAEYFNPGIDAPDNWGLGMHYFFRLVQVLLGAGFLLWGVGLWKVWKAGRSEG